MSVDVVWPYKPIDLVETLEWKTDVIRTKSSEQRISLRETPRRLFSLKHLLQSRSYSNARIIVRHATSYLLPDWTLEQSVTVGSMGSSVPLSFPTAYMDLAAGRKVILWKSSEEFEVVEVASFDANGITAVQVLAVWGAVKVYPLLSALAVSTLSISRLYVADASINMLVTNNPYIGATAYSQYRGHDIMPSRPVTSGADFEESIVWPIEIVDNELGIPVQLRTRSLPDEHCSLSWELANRSEIRALREWLYTRRGRQKAFWASSWAKDLVPASTINSAAVTIVVFAPPNITGLGRTAFDIEIYTTAGVSYITRVTNVVTGTPVSGKPTLNLTVTAIGATLTTAVIDRISFFRCLRFDSDRVELAHLSGDMCNIIVPCIEVPVP